MSGSLATELLQWVVICSAVRSHFTLCAILVYTLGHSLILTLKFSTMIIVFAATARSEPRKVLFLALSVTFLFFTCLCTKYLGNR